MQCVTVKNIAVYINTLRIGYVVLLKLKKHWSGHQKTNKGTVDKKKYMFSIVFSLSSDVLLWWQWRWRDDKGNVIAPLSGATFCDIWNLKADS